MRASAESVTRLEMTMLMPFLAAGATPAVLLPVVLMWSEPNADLSWLSLLMMLLFAMVGLVAGLLHALFLGIPFAMLLRRAGCFRWWTMMSGGLVIGAVPIGMHMWGRAPLFSVVGGCVGAVSALVFYRVFQASVR
jgi:hypothetical protein